MLFESYIPKSPLNELVECFIYYKGYSPEHSIEKIVPDGNQYLIFELDGIDRYVLDNDTKEKISKKSKVWYSGAHTNFITISVVPNSEMFAVQFKPYGPYPFLKSSMLNFVNKVVETDNIFSVPPIEIREKLLSTDDYKRKFLVCEDWLNSMFNKNKKPNNYIVSTCETMKSEPSSEINTIAQLISETNVSKKHFLELFKKFVGITPKQLQRIYRFNEILSSINNNDKIQWSQIALQCGYYDQAHFIKEFKKFCGVNPSKFISDYKDIDRTNFFPLD